MIAPGKDPQHLDLAPIAQGMWTPSSPAMAPDGSRVLVWTQPGATVLKDGSYQQKGMVMHGGWKRKPARWDDALALVRPVFSADGSSSPLIKAVLTSSAHRSPGKALEPPS